MTSVAQDRRSTSRCSLENEVLSALATVIDPELDEPLTELGFVRSVSIDDIGVEVHLRLPTSFCAPNFAYLMASDVVDALEAVPGTRQVRVWLDDHHDSDKINEGLAQRRGYVGTFGVEAVDNLDALRRTFQEKAHTAAMERACRAELAQGRVTLRDLPSLRLADLAPGRPATSLRARRATIGLPNGSQHLVFVDAVGDPLDATDVALQLRLASATRISIDGNRHFCAGLLATRYDDVDDHVGRAPTITNSRSN